MSGATALLSRAHAAGVQVQVDEVGRLKMAGRPEMVSSDILAGLRAHKAEILELLQAGGLGQVVDDDGGLPGPDQPRYGCAAPPHPGDPPRERLPEPPGDALSSHG